MVSSPVAYIVFNRPEHTARTFAVLREQRPQKLFIIADGPRPFNSSDLELCAEVRAIVDEIDWPCEVHRNYAESNLGLKRRVSSGLTWVFSLVERAIILEDDCLAHPDFFLFCDHLLDRYAGDERVSVITGNNFQNGQRRGHASYYFSKYNHCWGWATWRRSWEHYEENLQFWPEWRTSKGWIEKHPDPVERRYWEQIFTAVHALKINSWAYPWTASVWYRGGLTATPNLNLVSNIGFGVEATNTISGASSFANTEAGSIKPLTHPKLVQEDFVADLFVFDHVFNGKKLRFPACMFFEPLQLIYKSRSIVKRLIFERFFRKLLLRK